MLSLRIDLFIHNPDESAIEKKLDAILEAVVADPATIAALIERLKAADTKLKDAVDNNPVPSP